MNKLLPAVLVTSLLVATAAKPAHAGIGAKTTVTYKRGGVTVDKNGYSWPHSQTVLGREIDYSYGEIFLRGAMLAYQIYSMYSGIKYIIAVPPGTSGSQYVGHAWELLKEGRVGEVNTMIGAGTLPIGTHFFFGAVMNFYDSLGTQYASGEQVVQVRKSPNYDKVILSFDVWSNDDPFGTFEATPLYEQPGITVSKHVTLWQVANGRTYPRRGSVRVTVDTRVVGIGLHPIKFFAKETDCRGCLAITHDILLQVNGSCSGRSPSCNIHDSWINWYQAQVDNAQSDIYALLASGDTGIEAAIDAWKTAHDICGHRGAPGTAAFDACFDAADGRSWSSYCPDVAFGANASACSELRELESYIDWAQAQILAWTKASNALNCQCAYTGATFAY